MVRSSPSDSVTIIGSCVTLVEALKAADDLAAQDINVRVIDPFTIKPLDVETILQNARDTNGLVITVEDHYPEGTLKKIQFKKTKIVG